MTTARAREASDPRWYLEAATHSVQVLEQAVFEDHLWTTPVGWPRCCWPDVPRTKVGRRPTFRVVLVCAVVLAALSVVSMAGIRRAALTR